MIIVGDMPVIELISRSLQPASRSFSQLDARSLSEAGAVTSDLACMARPSESDGMETALSKPAFQQGAMTLKRRFGRTWS